LEYTSNIVRVNKINIHYLAYANDKPKLLMMHGLTANAHAFDGFVKAGLTDHFHVISVDLRGRGLSDKPAFAFSIEEHANDIIGLLDLLNIEKINLCGHSFGGLLATHLAFNHPERVRKIIILDAAPQMNPKAAEMLIPALSRLDKTFKSFDDYIEKVKVAPYNTIWDDAMVNYYRADVNEANNGNVEPKSSIADITQIAINTFKEPWTKYFEDLSQSCILINAVDNYTMDQPLLPDFMAKAIAEKMINCQYIACGGNHQTMLYGKFAIENVKIICDFLN
jgi:pimeloyl-ACP methyl ester carboxylesterase